MFLISSLCMKVYLCCIVLAQRLNSLHGFRFCCLWQAGRLCVFSVPDISNISFFVLYNTRVIKPALIHVRQLFNYVLMCRNLSLTPYNKHPHASCQNWLFLQTSLRHLGKINSQRKLPRNTKTTQTPRSCK